jgi:hypothetical protein
MASRLALGTAQFGLSYGVANTEGQVSEASARLIVDCARQAGLDTIDTAISYGDSEERLGRIGIVEWKVVTKLPAVPDGADDPASWIKTSVESSLHRLRAPSLYALLLHAPLQLLTKTGKAIHEAMVDLKGRGLVSRIGISVYHPRQLDAALAHYSFDIVQAPFNIIDRRLESSGWLAKLQGNGVEVHTRSAFLQGLLALAPDRRPPRFARWQPLWDKWDKWLSYSGLTPIQACVGFALSRRSIDRVVVGVDSTTHLDEIVAASSATVPDPPVDLTSDDEDLIDPSRWNSP